jgi:hypothetical protein
MTRQEILTKWRALCGLLSAPSALGTSLLPDVPFWESALKAQLKLGWPIHGHDVLKATSDLRIGTLAVVDPVVAILLDLRLDFRAGLGANDGAFGRSHWAGERGLLS